MSIKHLVLAGGAYKGLYIIGAMKELIKQNYIDISNIENIYGNGKTAAFIVEKLIKTPLSIIKKFRDQT